MSNIFACELGTVDEGQCGGRWNQLILWNRNIHYCFHKIPQIAPTLSQINPAHPFPIRAFKIQSNILLPSISSFSKWPLSFGFPHQTAYAKHSTRKSIKQVAQSDKSGDEFVQIHQKYYDANTQGRSKRFPSTCFSMRYLLIIPNFHAVYSEFYTASLCTNTYYASVSWNAYRFIRKNAIR